MMSMGHQVVFMKILQWHNLVAQNVGLLNAFYHSDLAFASCKMTNFCRWREVGDSSQSFSSDTLQEISSE